MLISFRISDEKYNEVQKFIRKMSKIRNEKIMTTDLMIGLINMILEKYNNEDFEDHILNKIKDTLNTLNEDISKLATIKKNLKN